MDIIAVQRGLARGVGQPRNAEEAKLIINFGEDHNIVRARGVQFFLDIGKYERNQWGVLVPVEGWEGVIEPMPEAEKEENKTDQIRADEAKLVINFGEKKEKVEKIGVQGFIDSGKYERNEYGVLVKSEAKTSKITQKPTEISQSEGVITFGEMTIKELQAIYKEKTGKNLSPAVKNNREWIISKL